MNRVLFVSIFCIAAVLLIAGCTPSPPACNAGPCLAASATAPHALPTNPPAPTATTVPTIAPTSTPVNYDGNWDGGTEANSLLNGEIMFQVAHNRVTEILFNHTLRVSGCTDMGGTGGFVEHTEVGDVRSACPPTE
ncbi:MAG: hypothetical protein HY741_21190 [Chloroflexi bacterium]|nr:hypothetical protein [Chloroflexota bacterium]